MYGYGNSMFLATHGILARANAGTPPVNTVAPAITGTAQEGQTLTCSTGTWTGNPTPTYAYQWKRNNVNIGSATNSTYLLVSADVGQSIKCTVTATNAIGSVNADSNTVVPIAAFSFLLDTYSGAAAAYSLRKLRSAYSGNCIRVRRSSDNAEQNIGFVNNVLDTASLLTFCGAGDGFVTTWYDQSGNTKNLTQTVGTGQPRIVSAGSVVTQLSKPTIHFGYDTGTPRTSILQNTSMAINSEITAIGIGNKISSTVSSYTYSRLYSLRSAGNDYDNSQSVTSFLAQASFGGFNPPLSTYSNGGGVFLSYTYNTNILFWSQKLLNPITRLYIAKNGGATSNANTGGTNIVATTLSLGGNNVFDSFLNGYIPEFILYPSDQTSNKTGIETNINTYYSIY